MNKSNIYKSIPFLSTILIIILISINNQKVNTNLKILIWNTPSLSLGNYFAISAGSGFLISYIISSNIAKTREGIINNQINYKYKNEDSQYQPNCETYKETVYDNTLIERDIKDPSPTINASFRVISKINQHDSSFNKYRKDSVSTEKSDEYDFQHDEINSTQYEYIKNKTLLSDWEDFTYNDW
tara:strand:+ start:123 stop:674 length:552 start_codon:yes stop_codon:yes gene_type:complete